MYFYGKKIFAVSQKEDAVTKKKTKKPKKTHSYLPRLLMVYSSKSQPGK